MKMAHHNHRHVHNLVPRQNWREELERQTDRIADVFDGDDSDDDDAPSPRQNVATVTNVVRVTMAKTFDGKASRATANKPETMVAPPLARPTAPAKNNNDDNREPGPPVNLASSHASGTSNRQTSSLPSVLVPTATPKTTAKTLMVATSSPIISGTILGAATGTPSSSPTSTPAVSSGGMSGGAKAGVALGVLFIVGAILAGVLFVFYRKKKRQQEASAADDEKLAMNNMQTAFPPLPAPKSDSASTIRSHATAPRLSLRPVTQFSPAFDNQKSSGNLLGAAVPAIEVSPVSPVSRSQDATARNSWEIPSTSHAAGVQNPFNDPDLRSNSPPHDPFGNSAAIETPRQTAPSTPSSGNFQAAPSGPLNDFTDPASTTATAAGASAWAAAPVIKQDSPAPPRTISPGAAPPSPAWTDDLPASPGPAPSGPPPVAGAAAQRGNGPAAPLNDVHRVQLDFKPSMNDELELRAGQLVRMLHEFDDGWALCALMNRSQQGVVPRTCLSKHPVKPRTGPPRQSPPGPRVHAHPPGSPMGHRGVPQPRPLTPTNGGRNSPHPPALSPANARSSPGPQAMPPREGRGRSNSSAPYAKPQRSMSPGPYGGGPQNLPRPKMGRPRSNSASQVMAKRNSPPGPSPLNNAVPARKPLPGQAI